MILRRLPVTKICAYKPNVKAVIFSVEKTIKRVGNWSSDVYFWTTPLDESNVVPCFDEECEPCMIHPRIYIIGIIFLLCFVLMILKHYDSEKNADSFE